MIITNSRLFQIYARHSLRDPPPENADAPVSAMAQPPGIMDSIIQYLINRSRLDVSLVRITDATEDSFAITIESRVTGTGPINSTISAMDLDLTFNGFSFGKLRLPSVHTSFWGTKVAIANQTIKITDMTIYKAFIRSIIVDNETCFQLENGNCTIKALGVTAHCNYCLEIPVLGMMGPRTVVKKVEKDGYGHLCVSFDVHNPGPVEIQHGWSLFELRNDRNETIADLEGDFELKRGWSEVALTGKLRDGAAFAATEKSRLVAMGAENGRWCNDTIRFVDTALPLKPEHIQCFQT